jgi:hypothetical protein
MLRALMALPLTETPFTEAEPIVGCFLDCDQNVVKRRAIDKSSAHTAMPPCGCGFWDGTQLIIPASTCTSGQTITTGAKGRFYRASLLLGPAVTAGGDALR